MFVSKKQTNLFHIRKVCLLHPNAVFAAVMNLLYARHICLIHPATVCPEVSECQGGGG